MDVASFTSIADSHASYDAMAPAVDNNVPLDITAAAMGIRATTIGVRATIVAPVVRTAAYDGAGRETTDKARTKSTAATVIMLRISGTSKANDCQRCHCRHAFSLPGSLHVVFSTSVNS